MTTFSSPFPFGFVLLEDFRKGVTLYILQGVLAASSGEGGIVFETSDLRFSIRGGGEVKE